MYTAQVRELIYTATGTGHIVRRCARIMRGIRNKTRDVAPSVVVRCHYYDLHMRPQQSPSTAHT